MTSLLSSLAVERLDHLKPVLCIDAGQLAQDELHRAPFVGCLGFELLPEFRIDASQRVALHGSARQILSGARLAVARRLPAGCLDSFEVTA